MELPEPAPGSYSALAPRWFTHTARLATLILCYIIVVKSWESWDKMPLFAQILVPVLSILFGFVAIHPRGWSRFSSVPFVYADQQGMYLPTTSPRILGKKYEHRWLLVPWKNIFNLRVDTASTSDGSQSCGAMDVIASKEEVTEFFYDTLVGKQNPAPGCVAVAFYCNIPPRAKTVVNRLKQIAEQAGP